MNTSRMIGQINNLSIIDGIVTISSKDGVQISKRPIWSSMHYTIRVE